MKINKNATLNWKKNQQQITLKTNAATQLKNNKKKTKLQLNWKKKKNKKRTLQLNFLKILKKKKRTLQLN